MGKRTNLRLMAVAVMVVLIGIGSAWAFSGAGSGTEADPYVITDVYQLQEMQDDLNACYMLGNDIDASETTTWNWGAGFKPVEGYEASFTGSFDGKGYRVNNLYIKRPYENFTGLFGEADGVEIRNVVLENAYVLGRQGVGGLVGSVQYHSYTGLGHSRIINCSVTGNIVGSSYDTGGIVGYVKDGTITSCRFSGTIQGYSCIGGIVGYLSSKSSLENSYAMVEITKGRYAGGLVGLLRSNLSNCYAMGKINVSSYGAGGLVGWLFESGAISNSYSTVIVNASGSFGGLIGWKLGDNIYSSYWDKEVSGLENMCGEGTCEDFYGKTTAEMQAKTTFTDAGWDFDTPIWKMCEIPDYPKLAWEQCREPITYYVDDDGPADFNKIQLAIDSAANGDTIIVKPGLYEENIHLLGKNITVTSINPTDPNIVYSTIIGKDTPQYDAVDFKGTEDANCILSGFNIKGVIDGSNCFPPDESHTHATISRCLIRCNGSQCGTVIRNCDGIIKNCLIADNSGTVCLCLCAAIEGCHGLIKNCTILNNNLGPGIDTAYGETTIENCIIYGNFQHQLRIGEAGILNVLYCNIQDGLQGVDWIGHTGTEELNWGPGNIDMDPCFVDPANSDYHLLESSPCIDAGDPNYVAGPNETDLDGNPRIAGARIDMGAFELQPLTPAELLLELADYISELSLHKGIAGSLQSKLEAAIGLLEDGNENNDGAAINLLEAFINAIEAQYDKKIPAAEADVLIEVAQEIIELLGSE